MGPGDEAAWENRKIWDNERLREKDEDEISEESMYYADDKYDSYKDEKPLKQ